MRFCSLTLSIALVAACNTPGDDDQPKDSDVGETDVEETDVEETDETDVGETDVEETDVEETDVEETDEPVYDGCRATPAAADRDRAVVISRPTNDDYTQANRWEVLTLSAAGELSRNDTTFEMGRATSGNVVFTPDGSLGLVPQTNGSLGIFTLDASLKPEVVEAAWNGDGGFYAGQVVMDPSGERAWVLDTNWPNNGGGIYEITLDCATGAPTLVGRVLSAKRPIGLHPLPSGKLALAATDHEATGPGQAYLLDDLASGTPTVSAGEVLFDYDMFILSSSVVTADGQYLVVADNSEFSGEPTRVVFASVSGAEPEMVGEIEMPDPYQMIASPFNDAVLVASGYQNALVVLAYNPGGLVPFTYAGEPFYKGGVPLLPASMSMVTRGSLEGLVLVSENVAIRRVQFDGQGHVEDLGAFGLGSGLEAIPGAIGVQP